MRRPAPQYVRESQVPVSTTKHVFIFRSRDNSEDLAELYNIGLFRMQMSLPSML
jgi:hypothetical protein